MKLRVPHPLWILVAALVLGVVAAGLHLGRPAYRQWSAIRAIGQSGFPVDVERVGPEWLREFVGETQMNAFDEIPSIHFQPDLTRHTAPYFKWFGPVTPPADDSVVANVRKIPNLKQIDMACSNVTDACMENVCSLQYLEYLDMRGTDISDASVPLLKRLTNLRILFLQGTKITDTGIGELKRALPRLTIYQ
jgi:hypothetical protein